MSNVPVPATENQSVAVPCPRCKKPLIDPSGLGWCSACGYCRTLAESKKKASAPLPNAGPNHLTATGSAIIQTPIWFWVTLIGLAIVVFATLACGRYLQLTPLARAVFTSVQIVASVAIMFIGQFIGLLRIAPEDPTLTFKDAVLPFRLYALVLKRLPSSQLTIYLGIWGLAAAISAALLIGGLGHWFTYLPGYKASQAKQIPKATARP